ncbi:LuxR family transcriptional regulator [Terrabacter ginsenosidimutans]|uniref:LuxR family transcriptional regulator n=2 Tax=Terrabacter ginsenosidimutans TaxID=490575 RepID=A0ABP7EQB1_9MICO
MLEELLEEIPERGGSLCLEGPAGLGKTSLLDWAGQAAAARGFEVWRAEGTQSEQDIPLAALGQLLTPVRDLTAQLPPEMRAGLDVALGFETAAPARIDAVADALGELLRRVDGPVLLLVDDLQWLDAESAQVLTSSILAARTPGVGLLAARRPQPSAVRLPMPAGAWPVRRLRPLGGVLGRALVRRVSPAVSPPVLASLVTVAAGNPLALVELPAAMSEAELSGSALSADAVPLSPRLERLHSEQILELPSAARQVLLLAALDDGHADLTTDLGEEERAGLIAAEEHGLIRTDARTGAIRFRHPLIGPTVLRLSTSSARRAAHLVLAHHLKTHDDRYAWHLAASALGPDEDVAALLESAAERALRRGRPDLSIQSYLLAAQLSPSLAGRARRLTRAASVGAGSLGSMQEASRLLAQAQQVHPAVLATVPAATVAAHVLMSTSGELANAQRVLTPAIALALQQMTGHVTGPATDPVTGPATDLVAGPVTDRAGSRADTSVALSGSVNRDEVAEALHHLLNLCLYACDERTWATFHTVVAGVDLAEFPDLELCIDTLADPVRTASRALPRLDAALAGLDEHTDANRIGRLAMAGFYLDRVEEVRALLLRQAKDAQSGGPVGPGILALSLLSIQCIKTGHWAEAERWARAGMALCEQSGHLLYTAPFEFSVAMLAAGRADSEAVARTCSHLLGWALPRGIRIAQVYAAHAQTILFLGAGDFDRAYREVTSVCQPGTFEPHMAWTIWMSLDLVEAAVLSQHPKEAAAHVDAMHGHDLGALSSRCALVVAGATAIAATAFDRDLFEAALAVPDAGRWPFDLARIELRYGQGLRRARFTSEARRHLEEALAAFERLSAHGWAAQARTELLATRPIKSVHASGGTGTLTAQERVVAHLAATGMANKAIASRLQISPRTVGAHLRNIFGKLGVRTRASLADALADALADEVVYEAVVAAAGAPAGGPTHTPDAASDATAQSARRASGPARHTLGRLSAVPALDGGRVS